MSVDRRAFMKTILGAGALSAVSCARPLIDAAAALPSGNPRRLPRVLASQDRVIRAVAGLRPFRPSGFVVRPERIGGKLVVHNYGHGGGGVTLSWGTAHMAAEAASATRERSCAVLGAGAVGLATAVLLKRQGFDVTVYARDLPPNTTSDVAGAQWSPSEVFHPGLTTPDFDAAFERACRLSYRYFQDLVGDAYGVRWIVNFELSDEPFPDRGNRAAGSPIRDLYPDLRELAPKENPFDFPFARRFATMFVEPPVYLNALLRDLRLSGTKVVVRGFESRGDVLALPEPLIVNCLGFGAGRLFGDDELTPIKGQLAVLLPQPEIDYIASCGDRYMFPRRDGILLGSTYELGVADATPSGPAGRRIVEESAAIFARLKSG